MLHILLSKVQMDSYQYANLKEKNGEIDFIYSLNLNSLYMKYIGTTQLH